MRLVWICVLLAGCSLYLEEKKKPPPDAAEISDAYYPNCGPMPADAGTCSCDYGTWRCNSCPFGEGPGPVPCGHVGQNCSLSTWEHDCDCVCNADGWWACVPGTTGSICPEPPPPDAAL